MSHLRRKRILGGAILAALVIAHLASLDGLQGFLFRTLWRDDTAFEPSYSAVGFWRVREGMTREQVRALAGAPLEIYPLVGAEGWRWSRSRNDSNYRARVVIFVHGRVAEKDSEYYVD